MENQEQPVTPSGTVEAISTASLTHANLPWFFTAAGQVYGNQTLRYLAYARVVAYLLAGTALAMVVHPVLSLVIAVAAIGYERDYLHRQFLQQQLFTNAQRLFFLQHGIEGLDIQRAEHDARLADLTKRLYDHLAEAEGLVPSKDTLGS